MAHADKEEEQRVGDGEDLSATPSPGGRGRILVAGLIGAALALAGIAADALL